MRKRIVWFLLFSTFELTAQNNSILNPSCNSSKKLINQQVEIEVSIYEDNSVIKASAMPKMKENNSLAPYEKRFEYLLINVPKIHQPEKFKERNAIWSLYPDTIQLKRKYLKKFSHDKALTSYFQKTMKPIVDSNAKINISYTIDELMDIASKFFYCDKVLPDSSVQAHICIGLNGIKEANWKKDYTLLEAFCYEAIFDDLDEEKSIIWKTFEQIIFESEQKHKTKFTSSEVYLENLKLEVFNRMKYSEILKLELIAYYQFNKGNLSFKIS
jgi:hypothetical protein